ncbi:hypothetical protein SLS60_000247 [Paraconiothyrium brasiliense]|uniref:RING-type domain-containing protein n=1 Tax=Paraconiothyrium brasiliense TaxID=300254 RepID=A0ABR3S5Q3_9PLEO
MSLPSQTDYIENHMQECEAPSDFQCSICQCDNTDEVVKVDHSGHLCWFHKKCLMGWFNSISQQRGSCPNDRIALFDPTALTASQLSSDFSTMDPSVASARRILNLMGDARESAGSPMEIAFNYHMPSANRLRADARQAAAEMDRFVENHWLASLLRETLVDWAAEFMHTAPHEIQHDLNAVVHHVEFLQLRADTLSENETQQLRNIVRERHAVYDDLMYTSRTNGMLEATTFGVDTQGRTQSQGSVGLATLCADQLLAVMDRARALILQAGTLRLRVEHDSRITRATSPAALRLLGVEEPDENEIALAQDIVRQFEDLGLELE